MNNSVLWSVLPVLLMCSSSFAGSDGIDIVNSTNIFVDNVFSCGDDDAFCIKALSPYYGGDRTSPVNNQVSNVVIFNNGYRGLKIGTETECDEITDVIFENCYVVKAGIISSLHLTDDALVHKVNYRNIYGELASGFSVSCSPFSGRTPTGSVRDIFIRNLDVASGKIDIAGYSSSSTASGVHFTTLTAAGTLLTNASSISVGEYASDVTIKTNPVILNELIFPYNGQVLTEGESIGLQVAARHINSQPLTVTFYADGLPVGLVSQPPYILNWTPSHRDYVVTAAAGDNGGNRDSVLIGKRLLVRGQPRAASIAVYPSEATVGPGLAFQFTALVFDQYGDPLHPQPALVNWTVNGGGSIAKATGLFTAGSANSGPHDVTAKIDGSSLTGKALVTVCDSLIISDLRIASGNKYVWSELKNGSLKYIDRDYTFTDVPRELLGLTYLRTANSDKDAANNPLVTFTVSLPTTVFLVTYGSFDTSQEWFDGFVGTGSKGIYKKAFGAGTIHLGPNGTTNMYNVVLDAGDGSVAVPRHDRKVPRSSEFSVRVNKNSARWSGLPARTILSIFDARGALLTRFNENRGVVDVRIETNCRVLFYNDRFIPFPEHRVA